MLPNGPENKNPRHKKCQGAYSFRITRGKGSEKNTQPAICPTEYRCYIKEGILYGQRVR